MANFEAFIKKNPVQIGMRYSNTAQSSSLSQSPWPSPHLFLGVQQLADNIGWAAGSQFDVSGLEQQFINICSIQDSVQRFPVLQLPLEPQTKPSYKEVYKINSQYTYSPNSKQVLDIISQRGIKKMS